MLARRHFNIATEHDRRSRSDGPENVADVRISSHIVIARSPAEDKIACARKFRLHGGQRTPLWWSDGLLTIVLSTAAFVLLCRNFLGEADRLFMAG